MWYAHGARTEGPFNTEDEAQAAAGKMEAETNMYCWYDQSP